MVFRITDFLYFCSWIEDTLSKQQRKLIKKLE